MLWKNRNKRVGLCVMVVTSCLVMTAVWTVLATPETALAKKPPKPDPVVMWNAGFVADGGFGSEIDMPSGLVSEVASKSYRTVFSTGSVVVTLSDGPVLDQRPFLMRFTDEASGKRHLTFWIALQDGHRIKDQYSTPKPDEGIGDPAKAIPFPETMMDPGDGTPWLEVLDGDVDENLDMLPGAHVILHLHVSGVPLIRMQGPEEGEVIGEISVGDIEFKYPG
ncbi:hypothetical protein ACFL5F_06825 [Planctomycetota bacterium]